MECNAEHMQQGWLAHLHHAQALEQGAGRQEDLRGIGGSIMKAPPACCSERPQGLLPARLLLTPGRAV